jgi:predicted phosphodiesterase
LHRAGKGPIFGPPFVQIRYAVRLAVLSDIHSNWAALEAVAAVLESETPDAVLFAGDVVGYGADPVLCLEWVREFCDASVLGNHDLAVASGEGIEYLPEHGQLAAEQNAEALTAEQRHWIANLPLVERTHGITLAHASPQYPERWMRIETFFLAQEQFKHFDTDVCFVGHTHLPGVLSARWKAELPRLRRIPPSRFVSG